MNIKSTLMGFMQQRPSAPSKNQAEQVMDMLEGMYEEFTTEIKRLEIMLRDERVKYTSDIGVLTNRVEELKKELENIRSGGNHLYTFKEIADRLSVSLTTVRRWEKEFSTHLPCSLDSSGVKRFAASSIGLFETIQQMKSEKKSLEEIIRALGGTEEEKEEDVVSRNKDDRNALFDEISKLLRVGIEPSEIARRLSVSITEIQLVENTMSKHTFL